MRAVASQAEARSARPARNDVLTTTRGFVYAARPVARAETKAGLDRRAAPNLHFAKTAHRVLAHPLSRNFGLVMVPAMRVRAG